ncbi:3-oxoacyl-[acyl-carrier-protein] reductase FabG-like [Clytia hemisphaerica]|uniref:Uncharacterized protein n=1 Tax=Clytia hemisphaerica TaxID=252671 RepID=A0A7M5UR22_9CNID|eukprot:TCONS_00064050-protein
MSSNVVFDFSGKVVLVTGAASGIGQGTAYMFAKCGARLVVTDRDETNLKETAKKCEEMSKQKPLVIVGDLTVQSDLENIINTTMETCKQLDVLVNNAGDLVMATCLQTSTEDFDKIMNINVRSVFQLTKMAIPHLKKTRGNIVNVSTLGSSRPQIGFSAYCMSKAALDQFTRAAAIELGADQVRVNCVNPSIIATEKCLNSTDANVKTAIERSKTTHALGRAGTVDEVAAAILFLASGAASYITGVTMPIDGGRGDMIPV